MVWSGLLDRRWRSGSAGYRAYLKLCGLEEEETNDCPHCNYKHELAEATYLRAGFNGIEEGDKDDKDCYECVKCGKEFGHRK